MLDLIQENTFWVAVSFVIFLIIAVPLGRKPVAAFFDDYVKKVRAELEEAARLRKEAETLLQQAKSRQHATRHEAEEILKQAADQAALLRSQAEKDLDATLKRREAQAADNLRILEEQATKEIREAAAAKALKAAEAWLQSHFQADEDQALVEKQIRQIAKA